MHMLTLSFDHGFAKSNRRIADIHEQHGLSLADGTRSITDCLTVFARSLHGFAASAAVFNFPFNRSTPELESWLPSPEPVLSSSVNRPTAEATH